MAGESQATFKLSNNATEKRALAWVMRWPHDLRSQNREFQTVYCLQGAGFHP